MKPLTIILGAAASIGLFAVLASDSRKPSGGRLGKFNPAARTGNLEQVAALPPGVNYADYLEGTFNGWTWAAQQNTWAQRRALLGTPKDINDPKYNELYYSGPWVAVLAPADFSMAEGNVKIEGKPVVSRNWYGSNPKSEGGGLDALGLIGMIGNYTLPFIPGFGTATNAALQGAVALGRGESLDNALIAAARGALPPYGQVAFDMAVGIAAGKKVDDAAVEAGLSYLEQKYPGARAAYGKGMAIAKQAGL
jgi:hypothetical protein